MKANVASIDIGSNSVLLLLANVSNQKLSIIERKSNVTALGRDLDKNGKFHPDSMRDTLEVLSEYSSIIKSAGLDPALAIVTATEASRVASNAKDFFEKVENQTKLKIKIISGKGEAYYSSLGATLELETGIYTIMDIGGASTELIQVQASPFKLMDYISVPIGSVRITNWINENQLSENLDRLTKDYAVVIDQFKSKSLICVAGTMTSIANMNLGNKSFKEDQVHNHVMSFKDVMKTCHKYRDISDTDLLTQFPFLGKRAKSIAGGIRVAEFFINKLNCEKVIVSTYGLMFGTALKGEIANEFLV